MMSDKERQMIRQWVQEGNSRVAFFKAQPRTFEFGLAGCGKSPKMSDYSVTLA
jgi:hypothetical protein